MNGRVVLLSNLVVMGALGWAVFTLVAGCEKEKPAATGSGQVEATPAQQQGAMGQAGAGAGSMEQMPMHAQAPAVQPVAQVAGEQTTCPVMGGPIDKSIFVEYKGKKVYFCCNGCIAPFQKEPEKYIAKLPQFAP
jgi:YHS domain-containing protein